MTRLPKKKLPLTLIFILSGWFFATLQDNFADSTPRSLPDFAKTQILKSSRSRQENSIKKNGSTTLDANQNSFRQEFPTSDPPSFENPFSLFSFQKELWENYQQKPEKFFDRELSEDDFLTLYFHLNSELKGLREKYRSLTKQYPQNEFLNDLFKSYQTFTRESGFNINQKVNLQMVQETFSAPGILTLKQEIIQKSLQTAELEFLKELKMGVQKIGSLFSHLRHYKRALSILDENLKIQSRVIGSLEKKYVTGSFNYSLLIRSQVEREKLSENKKEVLDKIFALRGDLNAFLTRNPLNILKLNGGKDKGDKPILTPPSFKNSLPFLLPHSRLEKMEKMVELIEKMNLMDPTMGGTFFQNKMESRWLTKPRKPSFMANPLKKISPNLTNNQQYSFELIQQTNAMKENLAQTLAKIQNDFNLQRINLNLQLRKENLYLKNLIPKATRAYDSAVTAYISGKIDFANYIDSERLLLSLKMTAIEARLQAEIAWHKMVFLLPTIN